MGVYQMAEIPLVALLHSMADLFVAGATPEY